MADETFTFEVKADASAADRAVAKVEAGLDRVEGKASKAGKAIDGAFADKNGKMRDAQGRFLLMGKGADTASRSVKSAGDAADVAAAKATRAASSFGGIGTAVRDLAVVVGGAAAGKTIFDMAESYANLSNRLRLVATDSENLNALLRETKEIAQETRSDWQSTVEGTVRMSQATKDLGLSQREVLDFMTSLNKTIIVSGASSQEASNGIIQLSQGLAAGALRGDELRSVMENLPAVADVIAKSMGKTRGELRKMGAEGKITAETMIKAFADQKTAIDEQFAKTLPTVTQAIQYLKNEAIEFFGEAGAGSGVMKALAGAIKFVADNLDTIGPIILGVAEALIALYVIEKVILLIKMLSVAIAANPLGAFITALAVGISLLRQFGDRADTQIKVWSNVAGVYATVGDMLRVIWQEIKAAGSAIAEFVSEGWGALTSAFSDGLDTTGITLSLENVLTFFMAFVYSVIAIAKRLKDMMVLIFGGLPVVFVEKFNEAFGGVVKAVEWVINKLIGFINKVIDVYNTVRSGSDKANLDDSTIAAMKKNEEERRRLIQAAKATPGGFSQGTADQASKMMQGKTSIDLGSEGPASDRAAFLQSQWVLGNAIGDEAARKRFQELSTQYANLARGDSEGLSKVSTLPEIELDREGIKGAGEKLRQGLEDNLEAIKEEVGGKLDDFRARVRDAAANRLQSGKGAGDISTEKGAAAKKLADEKAAKAMEKLRKEYAAIAGQANPIVEAQNRIAHAQDVVNRAVAAGIVSWQEGAETMERFKARLEDQLDPYGAMIEQLGEEYNALAKSEELRERDARIKAIKNDMIQKGVTIGAVELAQITRMVTLIQKREALERDKAALLGEINGAYKDYNRTLQTANALLSEGSITYAQYADAIDKAKTAYIETTPYAKSFEYGVKSGLKALRDDIVDVASVVRSTLANAFGSVETAITDLVVKGKADWAGMVQSMLADMTKLLLRWMLMKAITAAGGGGSGVEKLATGILGFASGGQGIVGGSGGTDSQFVAFRASPGETVSVTRPGQGGQASGVSERSNSKPPVIKNVIITDPNQAIGAMDTRRGERLMVQTINSRNKLIRGHTSRR